MHLAIEQAQKMLSVVITAGQRSDSPQFQAVLGRIRVRWLGPGRPRTKPDKVRAGKAYGSRAKKVTREGGHVVLIDGTLIRTRRRTGADNRRNYSGKHAAHGLLFLALTDDKGRLLWLSAARPGRSSEITTARYNKLVERLHA
ncbi:transposase [Streptomyces sp. NPDC005131]